MAAWLKVERYFTEKLYIVLYESEFIAQKYDTLLTRN